MKRAIGNLRRACELLEKAAAVYAAVYRGRAGDHRKLDLLEGFAGAAQISKACRDIGLRAMEPADSIYGWYLDTHQDSSAWNDSIEVGHPLVIVVGFPCTDCCVFNKNVNYRLRHEELQERRRQGQNMLKDISSLHRQADAGRDFLFENPPTSDIWGTAEVLSLTQRADVNTTIGHLCQYSEPDADEN